MAKPKMIETPEDERVVSVMETSELDGEDVRMIKKVIMPKQTYENGKTYLVVGEDLRILKLLKAVEVK